MIFKVIYVKSLPFNIILIQSARIFPRVKKLLFSPQQIKITGLRLKTTMENHSRGEASTSDLLAAVAKQRGWAVQQQQQRRILKSSGSALLSAQQQTNGRVKLTSWTSRHDRVEQITEQQASTQISFPKEVNRKPIPCPQVRRNSFSSSCTRFFSNSLIFYIFS